MGVSFSLVHNRKNEKNKSNLYTVNIRVTIDRVPKYLSISQFPRLRPQDWNAGKEVIKPSHPYHFELNETLQGHLKNLRSFHARCLKENKVVTHESVRAFHDRGTSSLNFIQFSRRSIRRAALADGTKKHYKTLLDKIDAFQPNLHLSDFDRSFLEGLIAHLAKEYANNTLRNRIFKLRKLYEAACLEEKLRPDYFLFKDLGIKSKKAKRYPLTPEQREKWITADMSGYPEYELWRDVFTFQLRTGMYYSDVKKSRRSTEIKAYSGVRYLDGSRFKNDSQFIIPLNLFPEPEEILRKWDTGTDHLFPGLISGDKYNEKLKEIAALLNIGIDIPRLSNKVARHTFSDHIISMGAQRSWLSRMLGHTKEETTSEYFEMNVGLIMQAMSGIAKKGLSAPGT